MDFSIILLFPNSFIIGINWYPPSESYNYEEFNLYLLIIQFKLRLYEKKI